MPAAIPLALAAAAAAGSTAAAAAPAAAAAGTAASTLGATGLGAGLTAAGASPALATAGTAGGLISSIAGALQKAGIGQPAQALGLPKAGLTGGGPLKSPTGTPVTQVGGGIAPQTSQNLAPDSGGGDLGAVIKQAIQQILSGGDTSQEAT